MSKQFTKSSFTLIELLLSVALITIIASFSSSILFRFLANDYLYDTENILIMSLKRAQIFSQANLADSNFGVKLQNGDITIFKGDSYAMRDTAYDEIYDAVNSINMSGLTEIIFSKFTGYPTSSGTIVLTTNTGDSKTVSINSKGMVDY